MEYTSTAKTEEGRTGKCNKNNTLHSSDAPTGGNKCLLNGPINSTKERKLLREYSEKYATRQPHNQACATEKENNGKQVKFNSSEQDMNTGVVHTKYHLRSHSLVCIENCYLILGIGPIPNK